METLGIVLLGLGGIGAFLCGLWLLFLQFQSSVIWGIVCVFLPLASLAWIVVYWDEGKQPFLYGVAFALLLLGGSALSGVPLRFDLPSL